MKCLFGWKIFSCILLNAESNPKKNVLWSKVCTLVYFRRRFNFVHDPLYSVSVYGLARKLNFILEKLEFLVGCFQSSVFFLVCFF